jgi:hypothetical protein
MIIASNRLRVSRPLHRLASGLALLLAAAPGSAAGDDTLGFAAYASRDTLLFVHSPQREATLRRARATQFTQALAAYGSPELDDTLRDVLADASLLLDAEAVAAFGAVLGAGSGELALAVEDVSFSGGRPVAELLVIADAAGLAPLYELLSRSAAGDAVATEALAGLSGAPAIDAASARRTAMFRGTDCHSIATVSGRTLHVAAVDRKVLVATTRLALERALDRARSRTFGSLGESARFREALRGVDPPRGALFVYADLRRVREFDVLLAAQPSFVHDRIRLGALASFDGLALALRGTGDRFHLIVDLERGRSGGDRVVMRQNAPFDAGDALPPTPILLALRLEDGGRSAYFSSLAASVGVPDGEQAIADVLDELGGAAAMERFGKAFGDEVDVFLAGIAGVGEAVPRLAVRVAVRDEALAAKLLDHALAVLPSQQVRRAEWAGRKFLVLSFDGFGRRVVTTVALRPEGLFIFLGINGMRETFERLDRGERLRDDPRFLSAFDRLDRDPFEPSTALLYLDSRHAAAAFHHLAFASLLPRLTVDPHTGRRWRDLLLAFEDPDILDGLSTFAARAESRSTGLRIEWNGP